MGRRSDGIDPFSLPDVPAWARLRAHPWHPHVFHLEDADSLHAASGDVMQRLLIPGVAVPSNHEASCMKVPISRGRPALEQMVEAALSMIEQEKARHAAGPALDLHGGVANG